jgi:hypothetical protein
MGASEQAAIPVATDNQVNAHLRRAAHQQLDRRFDEAIAEEIEGRRFYGRIILEIPFENGTAKEVLASKMARSR